MNSNQERTPGVSAPELTAEDLKLERVVVLLSYDTYDEIGIDFLAEKWGVHRSAVVGLLGNSSRARICETQ